MEKFTAILIPVLLSAALLRAILLPMKFLTKIILHAACGFICLWLLNSVSGFTGISLPVNAVTILISGFLGVPGIGLITFLELIK